MKKVKIHILRIQEFEKELINNEINNEETNLENINNDTAKTPTLS